MKQSYAKTPVVAWLWLGPLLYMFIVGSYFLLRFEGHWAEADSSSFTSYIRDVVEQGKLLARPDGLYPNGYAYQAISTFIVSLTGLDVEPMQQWMYPLLAAIVVLPAWVTYRELTKTELGATLATLLLLTQPEFLFVILRSSHEKFTRTLMLICLFLLSRNISQNSSPRRRTIWISLFFLTTFAYITSNYLLANSFIFAMVTAYALGWVLENLKPNLRAVNGPLKNSFRYVIPVCILLVYLFTLVYPPARHNLQVMKNTWDGIATLFLGQQEQSTDIYVAYDYISFGWINLPTYFLLSIANWIVLVSSFFIWLRQGWNWIWHSDPPGGQHAWFVWLLYAAFVIQGVLAMISDITGAFGSNLQLRLFPSFSIVAVALLSAALTEWRPQRLSKAVPLGLATALFCVSMLSVFKATNEPLFSNKWNFYSSSEVAALEWADDHLTIGGEIWTEFDERLITAYDTEIGDPRNRFTTQVEPNTRTMLLSTIIRLRSSRIRQPLPVPPDAFQIYDNGTAELYHLRPKTPYQP